MNNEDRYVIRLKDIRKMGWINKYATAKSRKPVLLELERFSYYLKREMRYDFPPFDPFHCEDEWKAWLFECMYQPGVPCGSMVFVNKEHYQFVSDRENMEIGKRWYAVMAWIHPYERNNGLLKKMWPRFIDEFGDFMLEFPIAKAVEHVIKERGSDWQKRMLKEIEEAWEEKRIARVLAREKNNPPA